MNTPREPLTPEERALAERLAAGDARREPGPALDARILAAARAAVDATAPTHAAGPSLPPAPPVALGASRARRPRRRWSLGLGVAASLLLAVTLAWQLRPQRTSQIIHEGPAPASTTTPLLVLPTAPEAAPAPAEAEADSAPLEEAHPANAARGRAPRDIASVPPLPAPLPPPPEAPAVVPAEPARVQSPEATAQAAPKPSASNRAQVDADSAAAAPARKTELYTPPAPPAPPPPPPAPAAVQALSREVERQAETAAVQEDRKPEARRAAPPAGEALRAPQVQAAGDIPQPRTIDMPQDQAPPALERALAEDRALPPAQWLQRIRRHRFEGDGALARASLAAFVQAHPEQRIPEDLRALLP
ncbi:hypothetical protein [Pseudoxanthomonas sp. X-1]|uniref:hypothetical protein n=1 Tax=Pseudoxanthomonas sp. X-1 TaxID=2571115 RepID=UPI001CC73A43|nr:hypothetical protein [Pseudoxanthomonas sp. X-1]UAY73584.1 hypothetical protein LAJ50_13920 [Pseudoxanthomonas sp. X-1]